LALMSRCAFCGSEEPLFPVGAVVTCEHGHVIGTVRELIFCSSPILLREQIEYAPGVAPPRYGASMPLLCYHKAEVSNGQEIHDECPDLDFLDFGTVLAQRLRIEEAPGICGAAWARATETGLLELFIEGCWQ
jgi:hypothetical protein